MRAGDCVTIGVAALSASNVTEIERAYSTTANYRKGELAYSATTRRIYESLDNDLTAAVSFQTTVGVPLGVVWSAHGLVVGDKVDFSTTGSLPPELAVGTTYYVAIVVDAGKFTLALTRGGAQIGSGGVDDTGTNTAHYGGNLNHPLTDETHWLDVAPMNKWAMYDDSNATQTQMTSSIAVTHAIAAPVDALAVLEIDGAATMQVVMTRTGPSRTNRWVRSAELGDAAVTKTRMTLTSNVAAAPNGEASVADKLVPSIDNNTHFISEAPTAVLAGTADPRNVSGHFKAAEYGRVRLEMTGSASGCYADFDLDTGSVLASGGVSGGTAPLVFTAEQRDDGFWRCQLGGYFAGGNTGSSVTCRVYVLDDDGNAVFAGNASDGLVAWGMQTESSLQATAYLATTSAAATSTSHKEYDRVFDLVDHEFSDTWASGYSITAYRGAYAVSDLPPFAACTISVTLSGPGTVKCGNLLVSLTRDLGEEIEPASSGTEDYSEKDISQFGKITITERGYSHIGDFNSEFARDRAAGIRTFLIRRRAAKLLWLMKRNSDNIWEEPGILYGIYQQYRLNHFGHERDTLSLSLLGLV